MKINRRFSLSKLTLTLTVILGGITSTYALAEEEKQNQFEVIEVTSTKRVQTTQDVPIAIDVISGDALEQQGIADITDMSNNIPSLVIASDGPNKRIAIRGMGSPAGQRAMEQAVALYVDGVYKPRSKQYFNSFLDVERVEVLKGPQAILFGINATAGAINIGSASNYGGDDFEGSIKVDYESEYEGITTTGIVGGGLTDDLGVRLALKMSDSDGYYESINEDGGEDKYESVSGRLSVNWNATDELSLTAKVDFFEDEHLGPNTEGVRFSPNGNAEELDNKLEYASETPSSDHFGIGQGYLTEGSNIALQADYNLGDYTLSAIVGISEFDAENSTDFDGGLGGNGVTSGALNQSARTANTFGFEEFEQNSVELRIISPTDGDFDYIAGVSYLDAKTNDHQGLSLDLPAYRSTFASFPGADLTPGNEWNTPFGMSVVETEQEILSAYFTGTYHFSDEFSLTFGGRYTDETKDASRNAECVPLLSDGRGALTVDNERTGVCALPTAVDGGVGNFMIMVGGDGEDTFESEHFLPELAAHWRMNDEFTFYARIAKAAKSGGLSSSFATLFESADFDDETVLGSEIGLKARLMDGEAELNVAIFNNDYEDLQVTSISAGGSRVDNAGKAHSRGIEVDGRIIANDWLTLGGSIVYLDAEYDDYEKGACSTSPLTLETAGELVLENGECSHVIMSGLPLLNSADLSANVYADVFYSLTDNIDFTAGVNVSYSGEFYTEAKYLEGFKQDAYSLVGAYIGISDVDEKWLVNLSGRNLTDETVYGPMVEVVGLYGFFGIEGVGSSAIAPRMIVLSATYNF